MGRILRIGVPVALQDGLIQIAFIVHHRHRQPPRPHGRGRRRHRGEDHQLPVPRAVVHALDGVGARRAEHRRGQARPRACRRCATPSHIACRLRHAHRRSLIQFIAEPIVGLFTPTARPSPPRAGSTCAGISATAASPGMHFSFSGYFCACGRSELSFLHNIIGRRARARAGRVSDVQAGFPDDAAAHGPCHGGGLAAVGHHLRDRVRWSCRGAESRAGRRY